MHTVYIASCYCNKFPKKAIFYGGGGGGLSSITVFPVDAVPCSLHCMWLSFQSLLYWQQWMNQRFRGFGVAFVCCLCVTLASPYVTNSICLGLGALTLISEPLMLTRISATTHTWTTHSLAWTWLWAMWSALWTQGANECKPWWFKCV